MPVQKNATIAAVKFNLSVPECQDYTLPTNNSAVTFCCAEIVSKFDSFNLLENPKCLVQNRGKTFTTLSIMKQSTIKVSGIYRRFESVEDTISWMKYNFHQTMKKQNHQYYQPTRNKYQGIDNFWRTPQIRRIYASDIPFTRQLTAVCASRSLQTHIVEVKGNEEEREPTLDPWTEMLIFGTKNITFTYSRKE